MKTSKKLKIIYGILLAHIGPQRWWPGETAFEVCIGAILTQNTNWRNVEKAVNNLKKKRLLAPKALYNVDERELAELIRPSGYFNIKAQRLRHFLEFLVEKHRGGMKGLFTGEMKEIRNSLLSVKGIGPETADSMILYAGGLPVFVVDAYTKRIFSRLGFFEKDPSYDEMQDLFMDNLEHDAGLFNEYHALIVMLGKDICKPRPLCGKCPLEKMCGYGKE